MPRITRRKFLKETAVAGLGTAIASRAVLGAPTVLTSARTLADSSKGELMFRPYFPQRGRGPNLLDWAYASDESTDAFPSNIRAGEEGVLVSDTGGRERFAVDVRWNVEGFGYLFLTADNAGRFYKLPPKGKQQYVNLPFELAKSRVARNARREKTFGKDRWQASREVRTHLDLSSELVHDAEKAGDENRKAQLAQQALFYALWGSEMMELEKARFDILRRGRRHGFYSGCDARAYWQMYQPRFLELFTQLFNYATITYVIKGDDMWIDFEAEEGVLRFENRDLMFNALREKNVTVEGRPLFWFHKWVTPEWIRRKSYDQLKAYVEKHTRDVIGHYPDGMYAWEIMNEFHDWANEVQVTPEQAVELTKLACDVARETNPKVHRLINNCCPFAEYVQLRQWSGQDAKYPQRTPWQFTRDLVDAGVDFTLIGQQMYFPYRDVQDIVLNLERYEVFRKPVQLSEVGASSGPTNDSVKSGKAKISAEPFAWRRNWDEELQADWLESMYLIAYSKPMIEACNWFDFVDPHSYIDHGGLLRSPEGEQKASYVRLKKLQEWWNSLPASTQQGHP